MEKPKKYQDRLDNLYIKHYLALEQARVVYPLHKEDKTNTTYEKDYDEIQIEFGEINSLLATLQTDVKEANKDLKKKNKEFKKLLDKTKNNNKKMNDKDSGYDDTERALIEMKNDYKIKQSETFYKAIDMTLGIILVCFLIYKKSK